MKDIQSLHDNRRISIKKVGVKTISYPITVLDKANTLQHTVATVNMYVNLPHHFKGTHMSRFVEILNRFHGKINLQSFRKILAEMKHRLDAEAAHMEMKFPYFLQHVPSGKNILTNRFECNMHGSLGDHDELTLQIKVPINLPLHSQITGGLPTSMGQWGHATVAVRFKNFIWIEDLISLIENGISHNFKSSTKYCVEKHDNFQITDPVSVESVTENLGIILDNTQALSWFSVTVENLADGYSTFATLEKKFQA